MASLALKALHLGAETKLADQVFHAVPGGYFRPPDAEHPLKSLKKRTKKIRNKDKDKKGKRGNSSESDDSESESGERKAKNHHRKRSPRRQESHEDSGSDDSSDSEGKSNIKPERPVRRNRRYQSSKNLDRGYDSDTMTHDQYQQSRGAPPPQGQSGGQYFPPPPHQAYEDDPNYQPQDQYVPSGGLPPQQSYGAQQSYSPNIGHEQPTPQYRSNNGAHSSSSGTPDQYGSRAMFTPPPEPQQSYTPNRRSVNPAYIPHSTYGEQYASGYQPSQAYYSPQGGQPQPYQGALVVQSPVQQPMTGYSTAIAPYEPSYEKDRSYSTYEPPSDDYRPNSQSPSPDRRDRRKKSRGGRGDDRSRGRDRSESSDRSRSRSDSTERARDKRGRDDDRDSKSRSRNRSKSVAAKAKEMLNKNRDLGASVIGVLAGGLLGSEMGKGNKFGTLAGAVVGGLGANVFEKKHADKKAEKEKREREREKEKEMAREDEKRRRREQQCEREIRRSRKYSQHGDQAKEYRPYSPDYYTARRTREAYRDRPPRTYVRSAPAPVRSKTVSPSEPRPKSPHVHFARSNPQEYVKSATAKATAQGLHARSGRDASEQVTGNNTTSQASSSQQHTDRQKSSMKKAISREVPREMIVQAAKKLKASRRGVFDGTVVEEVFLEMTGVTIGHPDIMASDWKN